MGPDAVLDKSIEGQDRPILGTQVPDAHSAAPHGEPDTHGQCFGSARDLHHLSEGDADAQPTPHPTPGSVNPLVPFCLQPRPLEF